MRGVFGGLVLVAVGLSACQSMRQEQAQANLDTWIGATVASYALDHGPPTSAFQVDGGQRAFQWVVTSQSNAAAIPLNGTVIYRPSQTLQCTLTFVAVTGAKAPASMADWKITSWRYNGYCT